MIQFQKVRYKNFLSSGNNFTEIDLDKSRTTLIVGQNGAGKSTILDAISFGLFGKSHRNIKKDQLVNSINNKQCEVEVEFKVGVKDYRVVRGIKPGKFEIYVDDTLINQNSHAKEYQKILESNILKLTHKTFHQVVVLGSSSFVPFMQLNGWSRRNVIEDLLDINVFSKMNTLLKEKNSILKEKINSTLHAIEINETKTESQKKYIRDVSKINSDARKGKEEAITESKSEIESLVNTNAKLQTKASTLHEEFHPKLLDCRTKIGNLSSDETEFKSNIRSLVKDAKFYETNENCPTCEQVIEPELKDRKLSEAKSNATKLQAGLTDVQKERDETTAQLTDIESKMEEVSQLMQEVQLNLQTVTSLNRTIDKAKEEIEALTDTQSDLAKANEDYDVLMKEYHVLVGEKNTHNDQYAYNSVIGEMLKDTGIKTKIIKQYLPVINNLVNKYLQILDFYVHFDLDESFSETIRSRHRDAFTYDSFSEGEKQRIDLALLFTWRQVAKMKNSIATNLLILDETFDSSLDEAGIENLMKILYTLGEDTNVFVISHKGEVLDGKFANKLEFIKDKNFSKMRVEV